LTVLADVNQQRWAADFGNEIGRLALRVQA